MQILQPAVGPMVKTVVDHDESGQRHVEPGVENKLKVAETPGDQVKVEIKTTLVDDVTEDDLKSENDHDGYENVSNGSNVRYCEHFGEQRVALDVNTIGQFITDSSLRVSLGGHVQGPIG